jgi:hypothetical protein
LLTKCVNQLVNVKPAALAKLANTFKAPSRVNKDSVIEYLVFVRLSIAVQAAVQAQVKGEQQQQQQHQWQWQQQQRHVTATQATLR